MSNPKLVFFLDAISRILPVLGPALRIPPEYIPVIQDGIAVAENLPGLKGADKLTAAVTHVTNNQPKLDGNTIPYPVGRLTDNIGTVVDLANAASLIGSTINKF